MDKRRIWYFTFGAGHALAHHVQPIAAESAMDARYKMLAMYGRHWCAQDDEERFAEEDAKYGPYTRLPEVAVSHAEAEEISQNLEAVL